MKKSRTKTITVYHQKIAVVGAFSMLLALFAAYIYFVSYSVVHVVMRQEAEQEIQSLRSEISNLEAEYITAQHAVSEKIASLNGYVVASNKIFIERSDAVAVLSRSDE